MKKLFISFASFSRTERKGLVALCFLLAVLILIRFTMHNFVQSARESPSDSLILRRWNEYRIQEMAARHKEDSVDKYRRSFLDAKSAANPSIPDIININTADSTTLSSLEDIGPAITRSILRYRKTRGWFSDPKQLVQYCGLPVKTYLKLQKHLTTN